MPAKTQNIHGEYVPAIPLPFYIQRPLRKTRYQCLTDEDHGDCERVFASESEYRGHFALVHILGLS